MSRIRIFHNPRCSKSRCALELLQARDVEIETIEYLKDAPSARELEELCKMLEVEPLEITRSKEPLFKELGLKRSDKRSRTEWINILAKNPKLIERPIVIRGKKAVVARPPEKVEELF